MSTHTMSETERETMYREVRHGYHVTDDVVLAAVRRAWDPRHGGRDAIAITSQVPYLWRPDWDGSWPGDKLHNAVGRVRRRLVKEGRLEADGVGTARRFVDPTDPRVIAQRQARVEAEAAAGAATEAAKRLCVEFAQHGVEAGRLNDQIVLSLDDAKALLAKLGDPY